MEWNDIGINITDYDDDEDVEDVCAIQVFLHMIAIFTYQVVRSDNIYRHE